MQDQRTMIFYGAIAAAVILAIIGILYLSGSVITHNVHRNRAILAFVLAIVALIVAGMYRPSTGARR